MIKRILKFLSNIHYEGYSIKNVYTNSILKIKEILKYKVFGLKIKELKMSKENIIKMFEELDNNKELKKKYAEMLLSHCIEIEKVLKNKLIEFGRITGFSFTNEELKLFTNELLNKKTLNKELSSTDLCNVTGGLSSSAAAINAYLGQAQSQTILFANMVNQQAQYANIAAATITQELTQLYPSS